jgi:hypothetical protein
MCGTVTRWRHGELVRASDHIARTLGQPVGKVRSGHARKAAIRSSIVYLSKARNSIRSLKLGKPALCFISEIVRRRRLFIMFITTTTNPGELGRDSWNCLASVDSVSAELARDRARRVAGFVSRGGLRKVEFHELAISALPATSL